MSIDRLLARSLGATSLFLGAVYLFLPRRFTRWIGVQPTPTRAAVVALVGVREVVAGVGLIADQRPSRWMWARVLGDVKDFVLLAAAMRLRGTDRRRVAAAIAAIAGITAVDMLGASALRIRQKSEAMGAGGDALRVRKSVTVQRPADEVYSYWRNFENLPRFMAHLESVDVIDDRRSHWKARAPLGRSVEWTAEITQDQPNEMIAWQTMADADVASSGRVLFAPAPRGEGTEVRVEMEYAPPAGALGAVVARLARREPTQQVAGDLRRFKQVMETGDVVVSEAVLGDGGMGERPAQPPADGRNGAE